MKYRYIICVILALSTLLMFSGCTKNEEECNNMTHWSVYVNGKVLEGLPAFVSSTNVRLPFLHTVEALGMLAERQTDSVYVINNEEIYILYYSPDISFVRRGDTDNLMVAPPGSSSYYCQYELGDVFLDSGTLEGVLYRMGVNIDISVDDTSATIVIVTQ